MKNAIDMVLLSTALVLVASCGDDAAVTRDAGDPEVPDAASPDAPSDASVSPDASLAECDLRDEVPCPTGYQCMTRTVQLRDWGSDPSMSWETLVCRDVTPVAAEGLPCTFERNELGSGLVEYLDPCE